MRNLLFTAIILLAAACGQDPASSQGWPDNGDDDAMVTRSQIILEADRFARIHWTMTQDNRMGTACDGIFVSYYPVGDRIGMGYKWGGWDEIDTFLERIDMGYGTGAGPDAYQSVSADCITGVSCTGLVSRAWHLEHKYTLNYPNPNIERKFCEITDVIDDVDLAGGRVEALKKGDALINNSHIILFVYQTRDGRPMIIDSSGPGVCFHPLSWSYLTVQGYQPIRYRKILEVEDPPGTAANPIAIDSRHLPFTDQGNTRDVVSMIFDSYGGDEQNDQSGPEVIYRLRLREAGTLEIRCTDIPHEGIDNDIFLLGSTELIDAVTAADCLARGDQAIVQELDSGTYFLVVDSGNDTPGEYTLTVEMR